MFLVFIILLITIYLTLLNFKKFQRINIRILRIMNTGIIFFYLTGLIFYVWNFDVVRFREQSFYVLIIAVLFIWADLLFRRNTKKSKDSSA
jgi:hypothetical protein